MKAFDKVPHQRLLHKVQQYGIRGNIAHWIEDFLTGREQRVRVNQVHSNPIGVTSGIPQGTVLGPLLFLIFINDLPEVVQNSNIYLFADDMKIFKSILTPEACALFQDDILRSREWSNTNLLVMHPEKCKRMRVGHSSTPQPRYFLTDPDKPLPLVTEEKDLGVCIDDKLQFSSH